MSKKWKRILLIAAAILVVLFLVKGLGKSNDLNEVTSEQVAKRSIQETVSASGKIQPQTEVKIQSEVSGQIVELPVKEGDLVTQGQLLVRINPDLYTSAYNRAMAALNSSRSSLSSAKARLAQAEAQFNVAELNFKRQKKLYDEGAISTAEMENAQSSYLTAQAEVTAANESVASAQFAIQSSEAGVKEASDNLKRTTILAPMTGTVTTLSKELGETVLGNNMMSGDIIMRISALSTMEVNVEVNESDIVRVKMGDTATVEVDAYRNEAFKGIVTEISNSAINASGAAVMTMDQITNFSVKVMILPESYSKYTQGKPENFSPFRPGMSATVEIITERANDVLSIPIKAVTTRSDTSSLSPSERFKAKTEQSSNVTATSVRTEPYLVVFTTNEQSQIAQLKVVKTGIQDDSYIQILEGLKEGEQVITGPYDLLSRSLRTGDKVKMKSSEVTK
jgi:HlyD family secretion protein